MDPWKEIDRRLAILDWTPYRLSVEVEDEVGRTTVYRFVRGEDIRLSAFVAIADAVGLELT